MNLLETDALTVHSKRAVRKALIVLSLCISCMLICPRCSSKPSPWVLQCSCQREQDLRLQGQRPDRSLGTHSSSSTRQWVLRPSKPPPSLLGFFPTKGILEWFYILLWNPYTDISQYVYLKECKLFQKTGWQNSISICCTLTYDNYCEIYFRLREITTTL